MGKGCLEMQPLALALRDTLCFGTWYWRKMIDDILNRFEPDTAHSLPQSLSFSNQFVV